MCKYVGISNQRKSQGLYTKQDSELETRENEITARPLSTQSS
jgi:hypothetical protein